MQARGQEIQGVSHIVAEMAKNNPTAIEPALGLLSQATGKDYMTTAVRAKLGDGPAWEMGTPGRLQNETALANANVSRMGTEQTVAVAQLEVNQLQQRLNQWIAENGRSYLANEVRGVMGLLDDPKTKERVANQINRLGRFADATDIAAVLLGALGVAKLSKGARRLIQRMMTGGGGGSRNRSRRTNQRDADQPPPPVDMDRHEWDDPGGSDRNRRR